VLLLAELPRLPNSEARIWCGYQFELCTFMFETTLNPTAPSIWCAYEQGKQMHCPASGRNTRPCCLLSQLTANSALVLLA
jgi:hypothetical protein